MKFSSVLFYCICRKLFNYLYPVIASIVIISYHSKVAPCLPFALWFVISCLFVNIDFGCLQNNVCLNASTKTGELVNMHLHQLLCFVAYFGASFNCFVHLVMYFYYLVSALGPQYRKYLWWKKYLTSLQLVNYSISWYTPLEQIT